MFPRGAAAKVAAGDEDISADKSFVVERVGGVLRAVILEGMFAESVEGNATEKAGGDDAIGIDIVDEERDGGSGDLFDFEHGGFDDSVLVGGSIGER